MHVFLAPTPLRPSVRRYIVGSIRTAVRDTFGFPFCQRLWALTKRQDDIVVADMVVDMEVDMVGGMEVDTVAN